MRLIQDNLRFTKVLRVIRGIALDAMLGAACGALNGIIFGGFTSTSDTRTSTIVWLAVWAGAIVAVISVVAGRVEAGLLAADASARSGSRERSSSESVPVAGPSRPAPVASMPGMAIRLAATRSSGETLSASA